MTARVDGAARWRCCDSYFDDDGDDDDGHEDDNEDDNDSKADDYYGGEGDDADFQLQEKRMYVSSASRQSLLMHCWLCSIAQLI